MSFPEFEGNFGLSVDDFVKSTWDEKGSLKQALQIVDPKQISFKNPDDNEKATGKRRDVIIDDENESEVLKAMRYGSLGRIICSVDTVSGQAEPVDTTVRWITKVESRQPTTAVKHYTLKAPPAAAASSSSSSSSSTTVNLKEPSASTQTTATTTSLTSGFGFKEFVTFFFKNLNFGTLEKISLAIRDHFSEDCVLLTPDTEEAIVGKRGIMTLFSILVEIYPDAVYRVVGELNCEKPDSIAATYAFSGTSLYQHSINSIFNEVYGVILQSDSAGEATDQEAFSNRSRGAGARVGARAVDPSALQNEAMEFWLQHSINASATGSSGFDVLMTKHKRVIEFFCNEDNLIVRIVITDFRKP